VDFHDSEYESHDIGSYYMFMCLFTVSQHDESQVSSFIIVTRPLSGRPGFDSRQGQRRDLCFFL